MQQVWYLQELTGAVITCTRLTQDLVCQHFIMNEGRVNETISLPDGLLEVNGGQRKACHFL